MADSRDDDLGQSPDDGDSRGKPTRGPIIAALVIVVILLSVILIPQFVNPVDERGGDDTGVRLAINDHYTARNALNYEAFAAATCSAKTPQRDEFLTVNRRSRDEHGPIKIPEISAVAVNGDRASATVHWHYEGKDEARQTAPTSLVRQDDRWKVC
ncbi:hypothetical protein GOARA_053_00310 [Gordonia araii NBRC 100433]|uniref:DUF4878 domain-containing protein n=1 Tax=Gordonia araii NBRC 100433 TaxID=1073574 RepID=G7H2Y0_9ACTN|nr:hypothetical protein [Gordonia araii]NNG98311.1 hypothetical protein [Gordonia araii NBRC 100433]GAB10205.1 hypothetical protein GOARA_053_00310 [Gordonia araii NBRC 100433]